MRDFMFVGPTGHRLPASDDPSHIMRLPPVKRGDVEQLVREHPPGRIIIVDGVFQQVPAVGHREIISALEAQWSVVGLCSMGAIRAYELRDFGMVGKGEVYEMFFDIPDLSDDELAVSFFPEPPYFPLNETVVDVRFALEAWGGSLTISRGQQEEVIRSLKSTWFVNRDWPYIMYSMRSAGIRDDLVIETFLSRLRTGRLKEADLLAFLAKERLGPSDATARV